MDNLKTINMGNGIQMLGNVPKGTCEECATKHGPEMPHNQTSLFYKYKYYAEHGQWPTWADAMAHCSDEVKEVWRTELKNHGIELGAEE